MPKIQIWKSCAPNVISHKLFMPKKVSPSTIHKFRKKTSDLWFTCGASIKELVGKETSFDSLFIRNNLTCQRPEEAIYYKANYATCCSHCGSTWQLETSKEAYPIFNTSPVTKHLKPILKRKAPKKNNWCFFLYVVYDFYFLYIQQDSIDKVIHCS